MDRYIHELPLNATLVNDEYLLVHQGGVTKRVLLRDLLDTRHPRVLSGETNARSWEMRTRPGVPGFPVPTLHPASTNPNIALDMGPNGPGANYGPNGIVWIDLMDTDILDDTADIPCAAARMDITTTRVEFGCRTWGGGTLKPVHFIMGYDSASGTAKSMGHVATDGKWKIGALQVG